MKNPGSVLFTQSPHKGRTIDQIASTDAGLLYLDEVVDTLPKGSTLRKAIEVYLSDPVIKKDLDALLNE